MSPQEIAGLDDAVKLFGLIVVILGLPAGVITAIRMLFPTGKENRTLYDYVQLLRRTLDDNDIDVPPWPEGLDR